MADQLRLWWRGMYKKIAEFSEGKPGGDWGGSMVYAHNDCKRAASRWKGHLVFPWQAPALTSTQHWTLASLASLPVAQAPLLIIFMFLFALLHCTMHDCVLIASVVYIKFISNTFFSIKEDVPSVRFPTQLMSFLVVLTTYHLFIVSLLIVSLMAPHTHQSQDKGDTGWQAPWAWPGKWKSHLIPKSSCE